MKKMKKLFAMLLTLAMVMGLGMTTFAASKDKATITILNAGNAEFEYAKVIETDTTSLTGWKFVNDTIAKSYTDALNLTDTDENTARPENPTDIIKQAAIAMLVKYVDATATFNAGVPVVNAASAAQIDKALSNLTTNAVTFESMKNGMTVDEAGVYAIKAKEAGYTFKTMAAYVGFGGVNKDGDGKTYDYPSLMDAKVTAKKSPTSVVKESKDPNHAVAIDDVVTYEITTYVPYIDAKYTTNRFFRITDKIDGATYYFDNGKDDAVKEVYMDGDTKNYADNLTVDETTAEGYEDSFTIDLSELITLDNENAGKKITVKYTAKITEVNVLNDAATHVPDKDYSAERVELFTGRIELLKYDADDKEETKTNVLAGAKFTLTKNGETAALTFVERAAKDNEDRNTKYYTFDKDATNTELVTGSNGKLVVEGLDVGTYHFTETEAPDGYSINEAGVDATLEVTGKATAIFSDAKSLADTKLLALPSTGGIGTTIFTVVGCATMIAAAYFFMVSRRKEEQ